MTTPFPPAHRWLGRRTLILGEANSGKTRLTARALKELLQAHQAGQMVVIDLAPQTANGIGGRLPAPPTGVLYLVDEFAPPRLLGKDPEQILWLARENAAKSTRLLQAALTAGRPVAIVNDAGIHLHAGDIRLLEALVQRSTTMVANAYLGTRLGTCPFSQNETRRVRQWARRFDKVIELSAGHDSSQR